MASINITVGRMLCGQVRNFLNKCKFQGMDIEYLESSGWVQRDFTIKGPVNDVTTVQKSLEAWIDKLDEA